MKITPLSNENKNKLESLSKLEGIHIDKDAEPFHTNLIIKLTFRLSKVIETLKEIL